jgi:hypothetical protein
MHPEGAEANQRAGTLNPELDEKYQSDARVNSATAETLKEHDEEEVVYITGSKLAAVTGSTALVAFLLMLDNSILSTVSSTLLGIKINS